MRGTGYVLFYCLIFTLYGLTGHLHAGSFSVGGTLVFAPAEGLPDKAATALITITGGAGQVTGNYWYGRVVDGSGAIVGSVSHWFVGDPSSGIEFNMTGFPSGDYTVEGTVNFAGGWVPMGTFTYDALTGEGTGTIDLPELPQRKLEWVIMNSNPLPHDASKLEVWAVFQYKEGAPTGIAFASKALEAGEAHVFTIYVAASDSFTYKVARVDYAASSAMYGGFPVTGTAYSRNQDGSMNTSDPQFTYLEGVVPSSGTEGASGNYASASPVTTIPSGVSGPGVNNTAPLLVPPTPSAGGSITVMSGVGGTTSATDSGTAIAIEQGANAIIQAVNNTGGATRQAIDRTTMAVNSGSAAIIQALNGFDAAGIQAAVDAGNQATAMSRQAEQDAREGISEQISEAGIAADVAARDAAFASKDSAAIAMFSGAAGGMTASKVTPTIGTGDSSAWLWSLDIFGTIDVNPFTNAWVQEKLPFLNWLVGLARVSMIWLAQIAFWRWLMETTRENAVTFMHTPSPPPAVSEGVASSNPFTALLAKVGALFSSLLLAVLILSSLSTITSVVSTWGTVSALVDSIQNGTGYISSASTGLNVSGGYIGRMVYFVTSYIPVAALLSIAANYIVIETGLVATMPVLVFAMRVRRW